MANNDQPSGGSSKSNSNTKSGISLRGPQRGLGVAQLEKIRLEAQIATFGYISQDDPSFPCILRQMQVDHMRLQAQLQQVSLMQTMPPFGQYLHSNLMVGNNNVQQMERARTMNTSEAQLSPVNNRWNFNNNNNNAMMSQNIPFMQPQGLVTRPLLDNIGRNDTGFAGPNIQQMDLDQEAANNENGEDIDLELKL